MSCLIGSTFSMRATVLRQQPIVITPPTSPKPNEPVSTNYDPITGEKIDNWISLSPNDDPITPIDESLEFTIDCRARGIIGGGVKMTSSSEMFGGMYDSIDYVRLSIPFSSIILKSDRIHNIRLKTTGETLWSEDDGTPMKFNINGIIPVFGPFEVPIEKVLMLERV